jgi:hypothetical protein
LGLDKWIKPEEETDKSIKKSNIQKIKPFKENQKTEKKVSLSKYILICTKAKCKYQKIIMKKELDKTDEICPKCKSKMKIKK